MDEVSKIVKVGPLYFDLTLIGMVLLTCLLIFLFVFICSRNLQMKPKGKQNVLEWIMDFVKNILNDNLSKKEVGNFHLFSFTMFLFILFSNIIGLILKLEFHQDGEAVTFWKSPTADPIVTLTLGALTILLTNYVGIKKFGFKKFFNNSYMQPVSFLMPIKLMEDLTNILTLGLRLYGNIFAGEVLLTLIAKMANSKGLVSFIPAIPLEMIWQGFSIFIGGMQAYIFVTLSSVYLSHKIETEH
ncbi:F0F1 ATP synthase subunit A [Vagococcus zengguangii]|uniref:ATP synthase subunit a n=1 Tax=Vagococcus zengguangii TaxID=2571750 RepID=A0A4D7CUZ9_9ENTE|nr:F0F1 ATP synthase subunit A [Vagococcus zengguangii]QCI86167.1 F0F1 ATP synthase subunit A [Vagococcus zengguangii]TLG79866.1 F0F1 ATP synthase subunit A [Vagococcus zengguangii]